MIYKYESILPKRGGCLFIFFVVLFEPASLNILLFVGYEALVKHSSTPYSVTSGGVDRI